MPMYDYRCESCGRDQVEIMSISTMENPETVVHCKECDGSCSKVILSSSTAFMSPEALGRRKAPAEFRDFLGRMKRAHTGSVIRDR